MNITIEGVDRSSLYTQTELDAIEITLQADQGDVGLGSAPIPTDDPTDEAYSGQQFLIESDGETILDGFVGPIDADRDGVASGTRIIWYHTVADENALLGGHRAYKWVRPAETDIERITAAVDEFLDYLSLDTSMILGTHSENLPAKTYITENVFQELQQDCGDPTAKDMFIENRRFHWHRQNEGDSAGLEIVHSGEDRVTKFAFESVTPPRRSKDGMDLVTDVFATDTHGVTYSTDDATAQARHDAAGIRHERLIEQDGATLAQLTTLADRLLATYKTERNTYEGTIGPLTSAQVKLIPPGSLITVTEPLFRMSGSVQRIAGVKLKYMHPDLWMATLQLGYTPRLRVRPLKTTAASSGGTGADSGGTEHCCGPFACDETDFHVGMVGGALGDISCVINSSNPGGDRSCTSEYDRTPGQTLQLYAGAVYRVRYSVFHGALAWILFARMQGHHGDDYAIFDAGGNNDEGHDPIPLSGWMEFTASYDSDQYHVALDDFPRAGRNGVDSEVFAEVIYVSGPDPRFADLPGCTNGLPNSGQTVEQAPSTGDGSTTTGTTDLAGSGVGYQSGTLEVFVNGVDWTPDLTESDPTAGTYELAYAPPLGSTVRVTYAAEPA